MAHSNLNRVINFYQEGDYAATVFRVQLSVEQLQKALLLFLGIQFKKTHEPSRIIDSLIYDSQIDFNDEMVDKLQEMTFYAKKIEKEETATRYGIKKDGILLMPEEYYDKEKTKYFLDVLTKIIKNIISFFKNVSDLNEQYDLIHIDLKKIRKLLEDE